MWISKTRLNILESKERMYENSLKEKVETNKKNIETIERHARILKDNIELKEIISQKDLEIVAWKQKYADEVQKRLDLLHYMSVIYLKGGKDEQPFDN